MEEQSWLEEGTPQRVILRKLPQLPLPLTPLDLLVMDTHQLRFHEGTLTTLSLKILKVDCQGSQVIPFPHSQA